MAVADKCFAPAAQRWRSSIPIMPAKRISGQIRFAFEVPDVHAALKRAIEYGATLVHEPVLTPWNDLNARVQSPDGLQITLFQVTNK
jgi:predicted enzyme related to lactoylglutathione lyase